MGSSAYVNTSDAANAGSISAPRKKTPKKRVIRMDPTQCLIDTLSAIDGCDPDDADSAEVARAKARNRDEAIEGLRNLADWLEKGGFAPKIQDVINSY